MYCISESSTRVVVGCFSFVMLCEKGTNDSLVHFASPPFTFILIGRYLSSMYMNTSVEPAVIYVFGEELVIIT